MAEIAIPLIGLGAMYILSNNKKNKEGFSSYQEKDKKEDAKNVKYPVATHSQTYKNPGQYNNPNTQKNRFFEKKTYVEQAKKENIEFLSLTGEKMNSANLTHNNMQPWLAINFVIAIVGIFPSRN